MLNKITKYLPLAIIISVICIAVVGLFKIFSENSKNQVSTSMHRAVTFTPKNHIKHSQKEDASIQSDNSYLSEYRLTLLTGAEQKSQLISYKVGIQTDHDETSVGEITNKKEYIKDRINDVFAKYKNKISNADIQTRTKIKYELWQQLDSILNCRIGLITITDIKVIA